MEKEELTIDELKEELEKCYKERDEYLTGWKRAKADFLNYKKEESERLGELVKYGNMELILKILPILDNFEAATREINRQRESGKADKKDQMEEGFLQIKKQLEGLLKEQGVERIASLGEKFDPGLHEVVQELEVEGKEPGTVVEEVQQGYKFNSRILRPAKVKIVK